MQLNIKVIKKWQTPISTSTPQFQGYPPFLVKFLVPPSPRWLNFLKVLPPPLIRADFNYAAACRSLKENPPQCITVEYKLVNSKIKNVMCLENKKSKELLNLHRNMAMKPQLGNSRKCPDLYWKYYPTLGQEIWKKIWKKKFERKEESKQGSCPKDWSDT